MSPPVVKLSDPIGLSDAALSKLRSDIAIVIESCKNDFAIFPLIEVFSSTYYCILSYFPDFN